jgi:hypothetical protein
MTNDATRQSIPKSIVALAIGGISGVILWSSRPLLVRCLAVAAVEAERFSVRAVRHARRVTAQVCEDLEDIAAEARVKS